METAMGSLCSDVNKLMDVAGQHGDHLREIFSAVPRFATKTELIAAIASVRQYKSNAAKVSSKFSGESHEDTEDRLSKIESGLKALTQTMRSSSHKNKEREDMVEEHQTIIMSLRQTNRKLEMRLKATEDEMRNMKEQMGLLTTQGSSIPPNFFPSLGVTPTSYDDMEVLRISQAGDGAEVIKAGNENDHGKDGEVTVSKGGTPLMESPSEELGNILSVPGPKSAQEIEKEKEEERERERSLQSAVETATRVEGMLTQKMQLDATRTAQDEDFKRHVTVELQKLSEFQTSHLATSSLSNDSIESLIGTSVTAQLDKAVGQAKRSLTTSLKEYANQSIAASEKRMEMTLEHKMNRNLPDVDAFRDTVDENTRVAREVKSRLEGVEQVLTLLDAEHSAIVATFRQHEIDRAASDHYCYAAIDTLTHILDKYLLSQSLYKERHEQAPAPPFSSSQAVPKPVTKVAVALSHSARR